MSCLDRETTASLFRAAVAAVAPGYHERRVLTPEQERLAREVFDRMLRERHQDEPEPEGL